MKDCWNQIGVWSRQTQKCDKLPKVVHCRNCEVYTNAGRQALDRRVPKEYSELWLQNISNINLDNRKNFTSIVVFRLGMEWFGLPTMCFKSIENLSFIHSIPRYTNSLLLGVVNIRGAVQLCFSISSLLQLNSDNADKFGASKFNVYKRLLVLTNSGQDFVFPVDEVGGIDRVDESVLEPIPAGLNKDYAELVKGKLDLPSRKTALLDATLLFAAFEAAIGG